MAVKLMYFPIRREGCFIWQLNVLARQAELFILRLFDERQWWKQSHRPIINAFWKQFEYKTYLHGRISFPGGF